MKERPILLTGPEVRAILDGRKAQLRRAVKPQPARIEDWSCEGTDGLRFAWGIYAEPLLDPPQHPDFAKRCPYGAPGDRLWVRETHAIDGQLVAYDADGWCGAICEDGCGGYLRILHGFVATTGSDAIRRGDADKKGARYGLGRFGGRWRPSIHMPRRASRITIAVTEVRVQRLQDITEPDAVAEGARRFDDLPSSHPYRQDSRWSMGEPTSTAQCLGTARYAFGNAWDQAPANRRAQWASNPWCWAVTFAVVPRG